jgi:hypothetical protein
MTSSSKAILTALLLALPLPARSLAGEHQDKRATIVTTENDGDTARIEGDSPNRVRVFRSRSGGYLGVALIGITSELREHYGAPKDAGVLVGRVEKDGPASKAGVEVGDILTMVGGDRVDTPGEVSRAVRDHHSGESIKLEVLRNRSAKTLTAKLDERPRREFDLGDLGELRDLPGQIRRELREHPWTVEAPEVRPFLYRGDDVRKLRERVEDLEKRLKDLEGKRGR